MEKILQKLEQKNYQEQMYGASDFRARIFPSEGIKKDSTEIVQVCFSQLQDLLGIQKKKIDPSIYSLRTLETYLVLTRGLIFSNFRLSWPKSAMIVNGNYLIHETSECHKIEKECTLLDILEEEVPEKYFLSEEVVNRLAYKM